VCMSECLCLRDYVFACVYVCVCVFVLFECAYVVCVGLYCL